MKITKIPSLTKLAVGIAVSTAYIVANVAFAAEAIEEIQITGSFIPRPADRPQPVSIMNSDELKANQRVSIVEAVRDMPQISSANTTGNWNTPTNSINLRGLGTRSTLVLLNGQRQTIDANSGSQVDVNNLAPSIMIERIELVLDGASALYGSDAVAGVANFITKNNFEGMELNVSSQHAEAQMGVPEVMLSGLFGVQGDDMGVVMGVEYVRRADRLDAEDVDSPERLAEGLVTALWNPGSYGGGDKKGGFFADPLCGSPLIGGLPANVIYDYAGATNHDSNGLPVTKDSFCRGLLSLQRSFIPETERLVGMAVATKEFDNDWFNKLTVEMNFARKDNVSSYGTGVPLLALPSVGAILPATNPGVIDANLRDPNFPVQNYKTIFTRQASPLEGALNSFGTQFTYRTTATLDGRFGGSGWDWRVTSTFSKNNQEDQVADTITDRYARAIQGYGGPNCKYNSISGAANDPSIQPGVGNCLYWNPFGSRLIAKPGDATYNDPSLAPWMTHGSLTLGEARFFSVEAVVTGQLWEMAGGKTGVAIGAQRRQQELDITVDPIALDGGFGFSPQVLTDWSSKRDTDALFAEMVLYPTDTLEFDVAARYEDTLGQSSVEPKVSALWTPKKGVYLRASAGSSFRLASENDLFGNGSGSVSRQVLGGEVTQATGIAVGNPNLKPEESDNWTVGFTWDITDAVTVDMSFWNYKFTNLVTAVSADDTLVADMQDGFLTDFAAHPLFPGRPNEVCEITGRWDPASGNASRPADCVTGFDIKIFNSSFINQDAVETNGLDLNVSYDFGVFGGDAGIRFNASYVNKYAGSVNGQLIDVVGTDGAGVNGVGTNPKLRANLINTFRMGNHDARVTFRYTDGTTLRQPSILNANTSDSSFTQIDATYSYNLPTDGASESKVTLAVLNVANRQPPLAANGLLTTNTALFDPRGRMWRLSYNYAF